MTDVMAEARNQFERIREGMEVYCCGGEKLGSVGEVHYGSDTGGTRGNIAPQERSYFEVKSGPLGLGKHLWFEARDLQDVGKKRVTLKHTKQAAKEQGKGNRPGA